VLRLVTALFLGRDLGEHALDGASPHLAHEVVGIGVPD
jgi:hypothetical protein